MRLCCTATIPAVVMPCTPSRCSTTITAQRMSWTWPPPSVRGGNDCRCCDGCCRRRSPRRPCRGFRSCPGRQPAPSCAWQRRHARCPACVRRAHACLGGDGPLVQVALVAFVALPRPMAATWRVSPAAALAGVGVRCYAAQRWVAEVTRAVVGGTVAVRVRVHVRAADAIDRMRGVGCPSDQSRAAARWQATRCCQRRRWRRRKARKD